MYTYKDYCDFAERLKSAGFKLAHEGFGPNIQRTGNSDPSYVVYLSPDYIRLRMPDVASQVLQHLPEFKTARAEQKNYHQGGSVCSEVWVYLSL